MWKLSCLIRLGIGNLKIIVFEERSGRQDGRLTVWPEPQALITS